MTGLMGIYVMSWRDLEHIDGFFHLDRAFDPVFSGD
jgi:hypothetical protein